MKGENIAQGKKIIRGIRKKGKEERRWEIIVEAER